MRNRGWWRLLFILTCLVCFVGAVKAQQQDRPVLADFMFESIDGQRFSLQSRISDKPALLYFWATWCPYCKKETPKVVALHEQYGEQIEVLAVNVGYNDSLDKIQQYIAQYNVTYPVMFDQTSELSLSMGVTGTPVFIIIDQQRHILYRGHKYPDGIESALTVK